MELKKFRNYEILNENPRISYMEADYIGATDWGKNYGYIQRRGNEIIFIFSADRPERLKKIYKESCLRNELNPKQYETVVIGGKII